MGKLKKNIWLLFYFVLLCSTILLASISISRWNDIKQFYEVSQKGLAAQWYGSFSSILEQQEIIITLIGDNIISLHEKGSNEIQPQLDALMNLNPDFFSGFALISPEGEVLEVTSNLSSNNVTNVLDAPQVRDSFSYALETDKMVLGRTYFAPRLVIPARKAIRNEHGSVIGVMTGALNIKGNNGFFSQARVLGEYNRISIIRSRDHFIQYASNGSLIDNFHEQPIVYRSLMEAIKKHYGGEFPPSSSDLEQISFNWNTGSERGTVTGIAMYNPRYEFWLISEIENTYLFKKFFESFVIYFLITSALLLGMYLLFRYRERIEINRRNELIFQANHDALTQLPNRNHLLSTYSDWLRKKPTFSLMFIDLDSFKSINDNFGHSIGDGILVELTKRLQANIRPQELLVRHGGDEFILLTEGYPQEENEQRTANVIYKACENIQAFGMSFSPGCSIGIARFPEHGTMLDELLLASDIAMYEAKKRHNSVEVFRTDLEHNYLYQLKLEHLLKSAIEKGEIFISFQPQVDSIGLLHGVEALVRWQQPELGMISPDQFINIAEQSGQMSKLGDFIIDQALKQIQKLYKRSKTSFRLSLNISIRQFAEANFADKLINKIRTVGIPLQLICVEITENLLIDDMEHMRNILQKLHEEGIRIALDDFGTGYSSLSILRDLPIDELKIDKSFVDNILTDETSLNMVKNIISIGRLYDMTILAEGVETLEQAVLLKECGCDRFQGYLFSRPVTIHDLEKYIQSNLIAGANQ